MRMKKYEITDIAHPDNPKLHRIRALMDLTENIHAGDLGGFVETEDAGKNQAKGQDAVNGLEQISQQRRAIRTAVF